MEHSRVLTASLGLLLPQESWDLVFTIGPVNSTGRLTFPNSLPSLEMGGLGIGPSLLPGSLIGLWAERQNPLKPWKGPRTLLSPPRMGQVQAGLGFLASKGEAQWDLQWVRSRPLC